MEILYYVTTHKVGPRHAYLKHYAPEIPEEVYKDIFKYGIDYEKLLINIRNILGEDKLNEFLSLMTDTEKFGIVDVYQLIPICLIANIPNQIIIEHITKKRSITGNFVHQAIICNNRDLFTYLVNNYRGRGIELIQSYFTGLTVNLLAIDLFSQIYYLFRQNPILILKQLAVRMLKYPELAAHVKYIFDTVLEKSGYSLDRIASELLPGEKPLIIAKCEILYLSGYYDFEFFTDIAKTNKDVKYWIDLTNV